jgi:hypothetical protein
MASENATFTAKPDYHWRKFRATYIIVTGAVLVISGIALAVYNNRQICSTDAYLNTNNSAGYQNSYVQEFNARWQANNPSDISTTCVSAARHGDGISPVFVVLGGAAVVAGYFFLPRAYRYLNPSQGSNRNNP